MGSVLDALGRPVFVGGRVFYAFRHHRNIRLEQRVVSRIEGDNVWLKGDNNAKEGLTHRWAFARKACLI